MIGVPSLQFHLILISVSSTRCATVQLYIRWASLNSKTSCTSTNCFCQTFQIKYIFSSCSLQISSKYMNRTEKKFLPWDFNYWTRILTDSYFSYFSYNSIFMSHITDIPIYRIVRDLNQVDTVVDCCENLCKSFSATRSRFNAVSGEGTLPQFFKINISNIFQILLGEQRSHFAQFFWNKYFKYL